MKTKAKPRTKVESTEQKLDKYFKYLIELTSTVAEIKKKMEEHETHFRKLEEDKAKLIKATQEDDKKKNDFLEKIREWQRQREKDDLIPPMKWPEKNPYEQNPWQPPYFPKPQYTHYPNIWRSY